MQNVTISAIYSPGREKLRLKISFGCKIIKQNVPWGMIFSGFSTMYSEYP